MTTTTPPERLLGKNTAPGANPIRAVLREALGEAHYERMRRGMSPDIELPPWAQLPGHERELYRKRLDYVIPRLLVTVKEVTCSLNN